MGFVVYYFGGFYFCLENQNFGAAMSKYKSKPLHIRLVPIYGSSKQNSPSPALLSVIKTGIETFIAFVVFGMGYIVAFILLYGCGQNATTLQTH
jgi:hypothetical protein